MNPFSLTFGKEPLNAIKQDKEINEIVDGFLSENPEFQVCMITGVRGSGKTVLMTEISNAIRKNDNWIVVEISPERDMLNTLAAELSNHKELLQLFKDAKINLSFLGLGLEIDSEPPITDVVVALDRMLSQLTKKKKKVLVTLDEAVSNKYVKEFTSQIQIYIRKNYNIFMLMTGLYENIYNLQNEESLTFLYRAPKFEMKPLNSKLIAKEYKNVFGIDDDKASEMAKLVKGYPYAYQVLGYLCYKNNAGYEDVIEEFDVYLEEYVYEKIWSEMSDKDRLVIGAIASIDERKCSNIREKLNMEPSEFSVYRDRLLKKGLVTKPKYGYLDLTLPRFEKFIIEKYL